MKSDRACPDHPNTRMPCNICAPAAELPPDEYMCPNCVTPWKCNGPHIPESEPPQDVAGMIAILRERDLTIAEFHAMQLRVAAALSLQQQTVELLAGERDEVRDSSFGSVDMVCVKDRTKYCSDDHNCCMNKKNKQDETQRKLEE